MDWKRITDRGDVLIYAHDGDHCITWGRPSVMAGKLYPVRGAAMVVLADEEFARIPAVAERDAEIATLKAELATAQATLASIPDCFIPEERDTDKGERQ